MRLTLFSAVWVEAAFLFVWEVASVLILANARQLGRYLLPWHWADTHSTTRLVLVRVAGLLNFIAAARMLVKTVR